jgi:hypothetical protein
MAPRWLYERLNVDGSQARVSDTSMYKGKRILVMTGEADTDHPRGADAKIVRWLTSVGSNAEFVFLPDVGIGGNGHMLMLEDNSDEIADRVIEWLRGFPASPATGPPEAKPIS